MPFLGGSLAFERYSVAGFESKQFNEDHIELLKQNVAGRSQSASAENVHVGFLGGTHLFDQQFELHKNVISEAVHLGIRIDTNQVPAVVRKAWLQMELAAMAKESETGAVTKAQRKEAKEAVEHRCAEEAATGKYRRMQQFLMLWDLRESVLYFGGSGGAAAGHCKDLLERVFEIEITRITAGTVTQDWAYSNDDAPDMADIMPASFVPEIHSGDVAWANAHSTAPDFLGNEFFLWLWWLLETQTDTITLADDTEATIMLNRTLSLECPLGEHGKGAFSAESPVKLPEAIEAIQSGKLPRKAGFNIIRDGQQYNLVLQAESFAVSGAKIHIEEGDIIEDSDRIHLIRYLGETIELVFQSFLTRRLSNQWSKDLNDIRGWLESPHARKQASAA